MFCASLVLDAFHCGNRRLSVDWARYPQSFRRCFLVRLSRCPLSRMELNGFKEEVMKSSVGKVVMALGLIAIGIFLGTAGIYIGETDDAPGAALIGILLMIGAVTLGVRIARRKPSATNGGALQ
jgi:hypothetical protein